MARALRPLPQPAQPSPTGRPGRARKRAHLSELTWPARPRARFSRFAPGSEASPGDRDHRAPSGRRGWQAENGSWLRVTCWCGGRMAAPAGTAPGAEPRAGELRGRGGKKAPGWIACALGLTGRTRPGVTWQADHGSTKASLKAPPRPSAESRFPTVAG